MFVRRFERLRPIAAFGDDFDVGFGCQKRTHPFPRQGFIIDDYCAEFHGAQERPKIGRSVREFMRKEWRWLIQPNVPGAKEL